MAKNSLDQEDNSNSFDQVSEYWQIHNSITEMESKSGKPELTSNIVMPFKTIKERQKKPPSVTKHR